MLLCFYCFILVAADLELCAAFTLREATSPLPDDCGWTVRLPRVFIAAFGYTPYESFSFSDFSRFARPGIAPTCEPTNRVLGLLSLAVLLSGYDDFC